MAARSPCPTGTAPSTSPPNPPPPESSSTIPRTRSVQFSTPNTPMSRSISPTSRSQLQQAESSADEITPIVGKERGSAKNKTYDTTSLNANPSLDDGIGASRQSNFSSARRRKAATSGSASRSSEGACEGEGKERGRWWKELADKYGSVELDNKGSVARDHLALERTFLAWLRTSLAFASIGIAITQLFRLNTTISERDGYTPSNPDHSYTLRQVGKPLGATFLGISILVLLAGGRRYFESQYWIIRGKFPASRGSVFLVTFIALALIVSSLIVVCVIDPGLFEKK